MVKIGKSQLFENKFLLILDLGSWEPRCEGEKIESA